MAALNTNLLGGPVRDVPAHAFPGEAADLADYPPTYIENYYTLLLLLQNGRLPSYCHYR